MPHDDKNHQNVYDAISFNSSQVAQQKNKTLVRWHKESTMTFTNEFKI